MKQKSQLLAKAAQAVAPRKATNWDELVPVVQTLLGRGFTLRSAVAWLVSEKAISAKSRAAAYHSIRRTLKREVTQ